MVRRQIDATRYKGAELWLSEWSSDSPAMIAHIVTNCLPHCHAMSQWTMSNCYEEVGILDFILKEGDNGWGMLARGGIAKPQFNTYKLMNRLGTRRLESTGPALASRTAGGASVLIWNLADVQQPAGLPGMSSTRTVTGVPKSLDIVFRAAAAGASARISYVDMDRGSPFPAWRKLGSPQYPTPAQMDQIRSSAEIAAPEMRRLGKGGTLSVDLPPEGVALIELVER
jgi:xylan 1,4-beta-xylosidase